MTTEESESSINNPQETDNNIDIAYTRAQEDLGLKVTLLENDRNIINITGSEEGMKAIFKDIVDTLGTKQADQEVDKNWQYVRSGKHLRPGGTYMVTINDREQPVMTVMVVNDRDYTPIIEEMHEAVKESILKGASSLNFP